jgi:adenylosuccinate synthase
MANTNVIIGAQWGDEGKGKIVDVMADGAELVVRFGGGANAGHTIVARGKKFVLHLIPSGILQPGCRNILGGGCVVDAEALLREIDELVEAGIAVTPERLTLADNAHVVTPYHRMIDKLTGARVGTTGRGIGPAYADKALRIGLRLADLRDDTMRDKLEAQFAHHGALARHLYGHEDVPAVADVLTALQQAAQRLKPFIADAVPQLVAAKARDARTLFEGAQGVMLDIDNGSYPFVTSSNTGVAGCTSGLGVYWPMDRRIAVLKAYATRVGNGPFPTELDNDFGEALRTKGGEFGATTGRPRRCGWLDLVLLKRAFQMNGFTHLAITKLDVLSGLGDILVAVDRDAHDKPRYRSFEGFDADLSRVRTRADLPASCERYLSFLEQELEAKVLFLSTGPAREHTIITENIW